jgi:hypothetical protein
MTFAKVLVMECSNYGKGCVVSVEMTLHSSGSRPPTGQLDTTGQAS